MTQDQTVNHLEEVTLVLLREVMPGYFKLALINNSKCQCHQDKAKYPMMINIQTKINFTKHKILSLILSKHKLDILKITIILRSILYKIDNLELTINKMSSKINNLYKIR